jgi:hypothetical protein
MGTKGDTEMNEKNDLKFRLSTIKSLAMLKMEKNFIAHCEKKYPRQPYKELSPEYLIRRIQEEQKELEAGLIASDFDNMMEECADISNLVDYLFEVVLRYKINQRGKL